MLSSSKWINHLHDMAHIELKLAVHSPFTSTLGSMTASVPYPSGRCNKPLPFAAPCRRDCLTGLLKFMELQRGPISSKEPTLGLMRSLIKIPTHPGEENFPHLPRLRASRVPTLKSTIMVAISGLI